MVHYAIVATPNPDSTFATFLVLNPQLSDGSLYLYYYKKATMLDNPTARTGALSFWTVNLNQSIFFQLSA